MYEELDNIAYNEIDQRRKLNIFTCALAEVVTDAQLPIALNEMFTFQDMYDIYNSKGAVLKTATGAHHSCLGCYFMHTIALGM